MASHTGVSQRGGKDFKLCDYGAGVTSPSEQDVWRIVKVWWRIQLFYIELRDIQKD
jgi:hypothetical protein